MFLTWPLCCFKMKLNTKFEVTPRALSCQVAPEAPYLDRYRSGPAGNPSSEWRTIQPATRRCALKSSAVCQTYCCRSSKRSGVLTFSTLTVTRPVLVKPSILPLAIRKCSSHCWVLGLKRRTSLPSSSRPEIRAPFARLQRRQAQARLSSSSEPPSFRLTMCSSWKYSMGVRQYSQQRFARSRTKSRRRFLLVKRRDG